MLCEHDLEIGGLRFFGPHRNSRNTDLFVTIGFEESDFNQRQNSFNMNMFFRASYYAVQGEKGKDFFVNFDVPVFIPKGNWVAIKFQIDVSIRLCVYICSMQIKDKFKRPKNYKTVCF